MPTVRGREAVSRYIGSIPEEVEKKLLRGAVRAGAKVIADDAKDRVTSDEVRAGIKVATKAEPGRMIAKVQVKGKGAYLAPWLEYGTAPHFISVADDQRGGMSIGRINKAHKAGSLVIGGNFVGDTVFHPGARPFPFLRPALDNNEAEAFAAAQKFINSRVTKGAIVGAEEGDDQ